MNKTKYWPGTVPAKDDFKQEIDVIFIDGRTKMGPWAIMTPESHAIHGVGLGTGRGQKYELVPPTDDGKDDVWEKVEG